MSDKPVLWHIGVSHFSEKARWALAWKGVEHERREPPPGSHMLFALWWSRGETKTFPVLQMDGERLLESSDIIAALEKKYPEPPLYPDDPVDRRKALDLEAHFDEHLGPDVRLYGWHHLRKDKELLGEVTAAELGPLGGFAPARAGASALISTFANLRFRVAGEDAEAAARQKVAAGLEMIEAELGEGEYLVGDRFSVADLTAASLLYPLVLPPEGPSLIKGRPRTTASFYEEIRDRPAFAWVERMFAMHRTPGIPAGV